MYAYTCFTSSNIFRKYLVIRNCYTELRKLQTRQILLIYECVYLYFPRKPKYLFLYIRVHSLKQQIRQLIDCTWFIYYLCTFLYYLMYHHNFCYWLHFWGYELLDEDRYPIFTKSFARHRLAKNGDGVNSIHRLLPISPLLVKIMFAYINIKDSYSFQEML